MLDEATRTAIFKLHEQGHGSRAIAQALKVARATVRQVIRSGHRTVPPLLRAERCEPWREQILELHAQYQGHLGRVYEELLRGGATLSYPALTAFCRRHRIGSAPPPPAGHYEFPPGREMQHDTSPHTAEIGGVRTRVQTASVVLCYSRMIFFQCYPRFRRFECKAFLAQGLAYFQGAASMCMVDNSHVIVAAGSGAAMIPAPEMVAFAERYGFTFKAHEKGDANRSARVEAPFHRIESAFLTGARFSDWRDLNQQAFAACEAWNAKFSQKLHASRRELFAVEQPCLQPLPIYLPEVYQLSTRIVDAEGYVNVNRVRYSVPYTLIGRPLEVRETLERIEVYEGPRRVASHPIVHTPFDTRVTEPTHRPARGLATHRPGPTAEEMVMLRIEPALVNYLTAFKAQTGERRLPLRRLLKMLQDYPREPFLAALKLAEQYRLFDLERLERMILKQIAHDYFVLPLKDLESQDE
jgi:transposase